MSVSLDQIKSLRERTGVSMTTCKNALEEAGGDEEKAIEVLRKKGATKAAERPIEPLKRCDCGCS